MEWNQQPEDYLDDEDYQLFLAQEAVAADEAAIQQAEAAIATEEAVARTVEQPLPQRRPPRPLTEAEQAAVEQRRQELQEAYRKYWYSIYGIEPTLGVAARAFREREVARAGGPEAIRQRRLTEFEQRRAARPPVAPEVKAAQQIQQTYRRYHEKPCENQNLLQARHIHPAQIVKLNVIDDNGNEHIVCYDVIELYTYLVNTFKSPNQWAEPTFTARLNPVQRQLIEDRFKLLSGCGNNTRYYQLIVFPSEDDDVLVPRELYDRALHHEGVQYIIYRLTDPKTRFYTYIVATGFHNEDPNAVYIPVTLMVSLGLNEGDGILLEDCLDLPRVSYLLLKPEDAAWYQIPDAAVEEIKVALTTALENVYVVQMGQQIPVEYGGPDVNANHTYMLSIIDIKTGKTPGRRIPAGVTKFTEVAIEFVPEGK